MRRPEDGHPNHRSLLHGLGLVGVPDLCTYLPRYISSVMSIYSCFFARYLSMYSNSWKSTRIQLKALLERQVLHTTQELSPSLGGGALLRGMT